MQSTILKYRVISEFRTKSFIVFFLDKMEQTTVKENFHFTRVNS